MGRLLAVIAVLVAGIVTLWGGISLAMQQGGSDAGQPQSYAIDAEVQSDPCGHDPYIFANPIGGEFSHNMKLQVQFANNGTYVTISGPAPWVQVSGGELDNNHFSASGLGTVAGYQNVSENFDGLIYPQDHRLTGKYTFGQSNDLPSGNCPDHQPHPAVYDVTMKPTPTPSPIGTGAPPTQEVTATPTPPQATPTPAFPSPNGSCTFETSNAFTQGLQWDEFRCTPGTNVPPFNRADIFLRTPSATRAVPVEAAHFVCQSSGEKAQGYFKGPGQWGSPPLSADVWSVDFPDKCFPDPAAGNGVVVYLRPDHNDNLAFLGVAFTNTQPTPTATPTRTVTPTPPEATATPPQPTVTPTSLGGGNGDCNGDGRTNSIDAAVALQFDAGYLHTISPACDVNRDGRTNSIDASLILQYDAALIHQLPV